VSGLLHAWRHPCVRGSEGLCLGRTDLPVDPRRAKRLAHRIRRFARRHGLAHIVRTSPLARCRDVGRWLARWGWRHEVDPALTELDFGHWDGRAWAEVPREEVDAWCADFAWHAAGGGECVAALLQRVRGVTSGEGCLLVTHGGWLSAAAWRTAHGDALPGCTEWPAAPAHGAQVSFPSPPPPTPA
jgi:alpha-ribazole phosphatase